MLTYADVRRSAEGVHKVASLSSGFICEYASQDLRFADGSNFGSAVTPATAALRNAPAAKPVLVRKLHSRL